MAKRFSRTALLTCILLIAISAAHADGPLPPVQPWSGNSENLIAGSDDPWLTPSERSGLETTPRYVETMEWLGRLVDAAPELHMSSIGKSHQGRDIHMVIASSNGNSDAVGLRASGKPLLLVHAGIHAGEIDGKDAGLMLLRDMTVSGRRAELLKGVNLLFIPILNVDGHERVSEFNRPNQRGPREMGWRTNARNQNLNRDFTKLDTPEVRALLRVIEQYQPDLYLDLHVTDGADYQYDITFGGNGTSGWSPAIGNWIEQVYRPAVSASLADQGHVPGGLIFAANGMDMEDGFLTWTGGPRYSNGYGDARHLPAVLVENHSLKPYRRRVLGTYVLLAATMDLLAREQESLAAATRTDRESRPASVVLNFERSDTSDGQRREFLGIRSERYAGEAAGTPMVRWTGEPIVQQIPQVFINRPAAEARRPEAYLIPAEWSGVLERIAMHGVEMERLDQALTTTVELTRIPEAGIAPPEPWTPNPFEGRVRIDPGTPQKTTATVTFPPGSFRIPTDQPLGDLVMLLLEPRSPDSFLQWGFFLEIFTRTEYAEGYLMEPLAQQMLAADPELRADFEARLAEDPEFAASPSQRLSWFYQRTPYYDSQYLLYPVARIP
jgi:hypothetical protein